MGMSNGAAAKRFAARLVCLFLGLALLPAGALAGAAEYKIYHVETAEIADNLGYYFVDEDGKTYPLYCHDEGYHEPPLNKISAGRSDYMDAVGMTYAYGQTTEGYLNGTLTAELQKKVLAAMYAGYPNDGTGLAAKYPTTPERYQIATQNAIWAVLGGYAEVNAFNDANMDAYFKAVRDYAKYEGGYGSGAPSLPSNMQLAESGGVYKTAAVTVGGTFDSAITLSLPANVKAKDADTNENITGGLKTGDRFYLEYTGANGASYSGSVGYGYQTFDESYIYTTDETIGGGAIQRMIRMSTTPQAGAIALSSTPAVEIGALSISKTVAGIGTPDAATTYTFTVTDGEGHAASGTYSVDGGGSAAIPANGQILLKAGETATLTGLAAGNYQVAETAPTTANYQSTTCRVGNGAAVTGLAGNVRITADQTAAIAFTNTYSVPTPATGDLTVQKTVAGNAGSAAKEFAFTVTLNDAAMDGAYGDMTFAGGVASFTLKHGESKTATGLPSGTRYTVTETDYSADGYVTTSTGAAGTISEAAAAIAAFTNTRSAYGRLTVSKTVTGSGASLTAAFPFTVTLADTSINGPYGDMTFRNGIASFDLKHGERKTASGLPAGTRYTVAEEKNDEYTVTVNQTADTTANGVISDAAPSVAAFNNNRAGGGETRRKTTLTVSKVWAGPSGQSHPSYVTIQLYRDGAAFGNPVLLYPENEWKHTWKQLDAEHRWTVDELNVPAGYVKAITGAGDNYTITNTAAIGPAPKTGDGFRPGLPMLLLGISMFGLYGTLWAARKKKHGGH